MKILLIGSGGREHTIARKLSQSPKVTKLWCAPGNAGISDIAECVDIKATDINRVVEFCKVNKPDMVFVAPDDPLVLGMVDALEAIGIRAFGPRANAALIEGSKSFAKEIMKKGSIPTAAYEVFTDADKAIEYVNKMGAPIVVKADGLALGKGVTVAMTIEEAEDAIRGAICDKAFGDAGARVVIEEFMTGPEVSVLCFTDGNAIIPMPSAQDHKRAYDNDKGPNTGGMGAFSPSRYYTEDIAEVCMEKIFRPTVEALNAEGRRFQGVIYFGLMLTPAGPKVVEYNARFGDPETQAVLPLLKTDLVDVMDAIIDCRLSDVNVEFEDKAACCVVMASGGYPQKYAKGYPIEGISDAEADEQVTVIHAGTAKSEDGKFITNGGRVLGVTAVDNTLDEAIARAYKAAKKINFKDFHMRSDIGIK